jgi:hypothetical protein
MEKKSGFITLGVILSLGLIIAALIMGNTWRKVSRGNVTITVTGSAQKNIRSDLAVWSGNFSNESSQLTEAYKSCRNRLQL